MYCQEWSLRKEQGNQVAIAPLFCRAWTCEICAPRRRAALVRAAIKGAPTHFLTLTVDPSFADSPDARAVLLSKAFKEIRRRAFIENVRDPDVTPAPIGSVLDPQRVRQVGDRVPRQVKLHNGALPFLAVFERTAKGEPHLHIICRAEWISQEWLSKQMAQYMNAPVVYIEAVRHRGRIASYVAKYIAKEPHRFAGVKRYWQSSNWVTEKLDENSAWPFDKGGWQQIEKSAEQQIHEHLCQHWRHDHVLYRVTVMRREFG